MILLSLFVMMACDKNDDTGGDGDPLQGWVFSFIVVDSAGNNVFDPLPISYSTGDPLPLDRDTIPFDPVYTYYVDGLGNRLQPLFGSFISGGMVFSLHKDAVPMFEERDKTNSSVYQWLLYLNPNKHPDTIKFKDPIIHNGYELAEYVTYNSDTVYSLGEKRQLITIEYK